jgi:hypothetical protein
MDDMANDLRDKIPAWLKSLLDMEKSLLDMENES